MNKKPIILIGGGGHCISCIDVIEQTGKYNIIGILDIAEKVGQTILNYPIIGTDNEIEKLIKVSPDFLITVGQIKSSSLRTSIFFTVKKAGGNLPIIISTTAYVSKYTKIGEGTIIMHQALINANATIGMCCIVNSKALIEHEATIGNFCHISTASAINGQTSIGSNCFIGSNTVVANNVSITSDTIIAAGAQVLKDIFIPGTYIGNPLKRIY